MCRASQPIYCQDGRKSASLEQLSSDTLTSQTGWQLVPCGTPFGIVTVFILSATVASWHPTCATLAEGRSGGVVVQSSPEEQTPEHILLQFCPHFEERGASGSLVGPGIALSTTSPGATPTLTSEAGTASFSTAYFGMKI